VAVDTETGEVEILNYVNVDDMGRVVWWTGAENQMLAGIDIQITEALFFGQIFEKTNQDVIGATINASYLEHKWPTPLDLPTEKYQVFPVETDDACGPFGAKGMGEPVVSNQACIANAIHNATGVWVTTPPITPDKLLKALGKA
jgi:CO/xanthine dehydrogenase Mo-binding subunit